MMSGPALCLWIACAAAACSGPSTPPAATEIDVDGELDLLHACALDTLEQAGYEVALRSDERRTATTAWVVEGTSRRRVSTSVLVHPQMGPAMHAARVTDRWVGPVEQLDPGLSVMYEPPADGTGGWLEVAPSEADAAFEQSFVDAVQRCWRQRREVLYPSP